MQHDVWLRWTNKTKNAHARAGLGRRARAEIGARKLALETTTK